MSKRRVGKVCSGPVKRRESAIRQRVEQGIRKEGGSGASQTQQVIEGGRFGAYRSAHAISWTIGADRPQRAINCPARDYLFAPENENAPKRGAANTEYRNEYH
ncbi:hypothetical protein QZM64_05010 [Burkholderia cepacia]|nr:hypothetical protein [Burkholderia cepacia]